MIGGDRGHSSKKGSEELLRSTIRNEKINCELGMRETVGEAKKKRSVEYLSGRENSRWERTGYGVPQQKSEPKESKGATPESGNKKWAIQEMKGTRQSKLKNRKSQWEWSTYFGGGVFW